MGVPRRVGIVSMPRHDRSPQSSPMSVAPDQRTAGRHRGLRVDRPPGRASPRSRACRPATGRRVGARSRARAQQCGRGLSHAGRSGAARAIADDADVVVECTPPSVFLDAMMPAIEKGRTIVTVSATGIDRASRYHGSRGTAAAAASFWRPARSWASMPFGRECGHHPFGADGHAQTAGFDWHIPPGSRSAASTPAASRRQPACSKERRARRHARSPTSSISLRRWRSQASDPTGFALKSGSIRRSIAMFIAFRGGCRQHPLRDGNPEHPQPRACGDGTLYGVHASSRRCRISFGRSDSARRKPELLAWILWTHRDRDRSRQRHGPGHRGNPGAGRRRHDAVRPRSCSRSKPSPSGRGPSAARQSSPRAMSPTPRAVDAMVADTLKMLGGRIDILVERGRRHRAGRAQHGGYGARGVRRRGRRQHARLLSDNSRRPADDDGAALRQDRQYRRQLGPSRSRAAHGLQRHQMGPARHCQGRGARGRPL